MEVVEEVEDESTQMSIAEGANQNPPLAAGEFWRQSLPPIEFGRIAAQTAKQVISQKVRDAERARHFEEYKDRIGEIVVGTVKRAESYSITVDLGRAEAVVRREEMIPRENLRQGDRVRAYIIDVREEPRGPPRQSAQFRRRIRQNRHLQGPQESTHQSWSRCHRRSRRTMSRRQ